MVNDDHRPFSQISSFLAFLARFDSHYMSYPRVLLCTRHFFGGVTSGTPIPPPMNAVLNRSQSLTMFPNDHTAIITVVFDASHCFQVLVSLVGRGVLPSIMNTAFPTTMVAIQSAAPKALAIPSRGSGALLIGSLQLVMKTKEDIAIHSRHQSAEEREGSKITLIGEHGRRLTTIQDGNRWRWFRGTGCQVRHPKCKAVKTLEAHRTPQQYRSLNACKSGRFHMTNHKYL